MKSYRAYEDLDGPFGPLAALAAANRPQTVPRLKHSAECKPPS